MQTKDKQSIKNLNFFWRQYYINKENYEIAEQKKLSKKLFI
jgi:hypothetical protein